MSDQNSGPTENPYGQQSTPPPNPYGAPPQGGGSYSSTPPPPPASSPDPYAGSYGQSSTDPSGYSAYGAPVVDKRPGTVTAAGWITWIFSGLTALLLLFGMIVLAGGSDAIIREIERQPGFEDMQFSADELIGVAQGFLGFLVVCCLLGILFGVLAFRRSNVGRILLVIWSGLLALLSLVTIFSGTSVVTLVAAVAVIVLLFTGGANQWYARRP